MENSANLELPYIMPSQAQKHVTHNEALQVLDAVVQLTAASHTEISPPGSPQEGQRWIVPSGATGAWSGQAHRIAAWYDGAWLFIAPKPGWTAYVQAGSSLLAFNGAQWVNALGIGIGDVEMLGVRTAADSDNRLAVKSNAALFSHDDVTPGTGDMRIAINKAAAGNTASLLFQAGFSGRAEMGASGDDDFHVKVSPDGATWRDAIVIDRATGAASFPNTVMGGGAPDMLYVEQYANGASASGSADMWNKRNLNQEQRDAHGDGALAAGVLTLQPGNYYAEAWAVCHRGGRHKLRLRRTSGTAATLVVGAGMLAQDTNNVTNLARAEGFFTLDAEATLELQHFIDDSGAGSNNLGVGSVTETTEPEIYACLKLWRAG